MDERHRIQSQASVYLQKNPSDAAITIGELRDMARNINDPSLFAANLRMQRYAANTKFSLTNYPVLPYNGCAYVPGESPLMASPPYSPKGG